MTHFDLGALFDDSSRPDGGVVRVADGRTTAQRLAVRAIDEGVSIASMTRVASA